MDVNRREINLAILFTSLCCLALSTGCRSSKGEVPDGGDESQPAATTPAETTPAETSPAETTPAETTPAETTPAAPPSFDHSSFNALLGAHVDQAAGRVDYDGFKADEAKLDAYLETIAGADLSIYSEQEVFAYYINAYNAYTIKLILERYPKIKSIRDYKEPWKQKRWEVAGETLSLDAIEHERLRPVYKDPRIHFAVNCASIGCPPLRSEAYVADKLDEQLTAASNETLQNDRYVKVKSGRLYVTKLMDWYGDDFVNSEWRGTGESIPGFVSMYASEEVKSFIESKGGKPKVRFLDYDWNLNKK